MNGRHELFIPSDPASAARFCLTRSVALALPLFSQPSRKTAANCVSACALSPRLSILCWSMTIPRSPSAI